MDSEQLRARKVIRDPVQGDIELSELELALVDLPEFQRMRGVRQLGTVHLLYPGAMHTRFDHSLGTLAVAQEMVNAINRNIDSSRLDEEDQVVVRAAALLHDITHVPFGHTLEDEANLYPRHDDPKNYAMFLDPDRSMGNLIVKLSSEDVRRRVLAVLTAKDDADLRALGRDRALADIVGNTICADLLDYLKRDCFFTGLDETVSDRIMRFLYVRESDGQRQVVLRLYKLSSRRPRQDVISDAIGLLRLRYRLAERVYYHHSKMSTSAMVAAAVQHSRFREDRDGLYQFTDDELLKAIADDSEYPTGAMLASALLTRRLYKPVYLVGYTRATYTDDKPRLIEDLGYLRTDPAQRTTTERLLEEEAGLARGWVVLYYPDPRMQLKLALAAVAVDKDHVSVLEDIADDSYQQEITTIKHRHRALWRMLVLVNPAATEEERVRLAALSAGLFGLQNEHPQYRAARPVAPVLDVSRRCLEEWRAKFQWFEHGELRELMNDGEKVRRLTRGEITDISSAEEVAQLNLLLHLRDIADQDAVNGGPICSRRAELEENILVRPEEILRLAENRPAARFADRQPDSATRDFARSLFIAALDIDSE